MASPGASGSITKILRSPFPNVLTNASFVPLGDQTGVDSKLALPLSVRFVTVFGASGLTRQMSTSQRYAISSVSASAGAARAAIAAADATNATRSLSDGNA